MKKAFLSKSGFCTKKRQKIVLILVLMSALKCFAIFLCVFDYAQTHKVPALLEALGVATWRKATLTRNKLRFSPKIFKKWVLGFFRHCTAETLRNFSALFWLRSNLQDSLRLDCKRRANNKNGMFGSKKLTSGPEKLLKKRVFRGFPENSEKKFAISPFRSIVIKLPG